MFTIHDDRDRWKSRATQAEHLNEESHRKVVAMRHEVTLAEGTTAAVALAAHELLDRIERQAPAEEIDRACAILRRALDCEYALRLATELDRAVNMYTACTIFRQILKRIRIREDVRQAAERWGSDKLVAQRIGAHRHRYF